MSIKAILFDLDGTLLRMDMDEFVRLYFGSLTKKFEPYGYETEALAKSIWAGINAMRSNDGKKLNSQVFWDVFYGIYGEEKVKGDLWVFDEYYDKDFEITKGGCGCNPKAAEIVRYIKSQGLKVVLATNPIFPQAATRKRMSWAGLCPEDFELFTHYENSTYAKPNLDYYREILNKLELEPQECVMVGNDVSEDMVAETLGMKVFLLTDDLLNRDNADISRYPSGSFDELKKFIDSLDKG